MIFLNKHYKHISADCIIESKKFNWDTISLVLFKNYVRALNNE